MILLPRNNKREGGSILAYFIVAVALLLTIASVGAYVSQTSKMSRRKQDMVNALQYAESGAALACSQISDAFNSVSVNSNFLVRLESGAAPYTKNTGLSTSTNLVYERSLTSPFTNQTVLVKVKLTNSTAPESVTITASATVGAVTQTAVSQVDMSFGWAAAIISDAPGSTATKADKKAGQAGNVSLTQPATSGLISVYGGVLANGRVNTGTVGSGNGKVNIDSSTISMTNYGKATQVPDYTLEGSADQLFDFNRFIACAKASGNYYSNLSSFITAAKTNVLEGVVCVTVSKTECGGMKLTTANLPNGIRIRGCLVVNFSTASGVCSTDKLVNETKMEINAISASDFAALSGTSPATFKTGYPPTYTNPAKNPVNVNMAPYGFANFKAEDDLPAIMYNIGIFDIHGPANVCGVVYSPSFMEIENKQTNQKQYFNGCLIGGGGIMVENSKTGSQSIVVYDQNALNRLVTSGNKGKMAKVVRRL